MIPVVTVEEMRAIDAASSDDEATLIARAGWAVARQAKQMLRGTYGRRVVVIAGKGNNGADGKTAARILQSRGARAYVVAAGELETTPECDLVIDAAYGTGFRGEYRAPQTNGTPVLSVDIPSGVNGDTGEACDGAVHADATVTFAAYKPGHLFGKGADLTGDVYLADIGLDASVARMHVVEASDVLEALRPSQRESHKWRSAVAVVAGSPGMMGAAIFASRAAMRSGAGMVHLRSPGLAPEQFPAGEAVCVALPAKDWADDVLSELSRMHALVIGPGLGREEHTVAAIRHVISSAEIPVMADSDALYALGSDAASVLKKRKAATVLTPHDGEFKFLTGHPPSQQRIDDVRSLANTTGAVVLLKGSTTIVASPDGNVLFSVMGDARLATAGTGDVLSGVVGALLAKGMKTHEAAAYGAYIHGAAAEKTGLSRGLLAGDLPDSIAKWVSEKLGPTRR